MKCFVDDIHFAWAATYTGAGREAHILFNTRADTRLINNGHTAKVTEVLTEEEATLLKELCDRIAARIAGQWEKAE